MQSQSQNYIRLLKESSQSFPIEPFPKFFAETVERRARLPDCCLKIILIEETWSLSRQAGTPGPAVVELEFLFI